LIKALRRLVFAVIGVFAVATVVATAQIVATSTEDELASKHWVEEAGRDVHFE
jgi:hypothetical protein